MNTTCWHCNAAYQTAEPVCPTCCATNANADLEQAQAEMANDGLISHDFEFRDDSFDHEFGTERIHCWACQRCGETRPMEAGDYDNFDDYLEAPV